MICLIKIVFVDINQAIIAESIRKGYYDVISIPFLNFNNKIYHSCEQQNLDGLLKKIIVILKL